jgi:hypothetical protein
VDGVAVSERQRFVVGGRSAVSLPYEAVRGIDADFMDTHMSSAK